MNLAKILWLRFRLWLVRQTLFAYLSGWQPKSGGLRPPFFFTGIRQAPRRPG